MASIIELQNRIKLLDSFSKVVNIQKIVVIKKVAELKIRMKALTNSYDLLFKTISDIRIEQPSLFDNKIFVSQSHVEENRIENLEHPLHAVLTNDKRTMVQKAIFLMSTKPIDKLSRYSIKRMAEEAQRAYKKDIIYIALGDVLNEELKKLKVPVYASLGDDIVFSNSNLVFKNIAELTLQLYDSLTATNVSFVFDDIEKPKELKQIPLLPFTENLGRDSIDFSALSGTKDRDINKILRNIVIKDAVFERGLEITSSFLTKMQIQNVVELAHLAYQFSSANRELYSLDEKEKNVDAEKDVTTLKIQRVRKESITNELISNSGAFMSMGLSEKEENDE